MDRRSFLSRSALAGAAALFVRTAQAQDHGEHGEHGVGTPGKIRTDEAPVRPAIPEEPPGTLDTPHPRIVTPNGRTLAWREVDGVKVFHLVAEVVQHEFAPGLVVETWGYNGTAFGPTIEAVAGDRVRIYVTNRLPEPTTVHWHGVLLPAGMDGVTGLNQAPIPVGETFVYEFTLEHAGTFMYHPHADEMVQIGMGMSGFIIVHPRGRERTVVDRDFCIMLHEWSVPIGASRPDPREMTDFNMATFNHKAFPATEPLVVRTGQRVRIRFGNVSPMHNHPIHLHGHNFRITGTDGGQIPASAQWPETTVIVPVGSTRDIEFVAVAGDWAMHCHFTHHLMNQMGHGGPNVMGMDIKGLDKHVRKQVPGYMTMGHDGMLDMATHKMPVPENSIPMMGVDGPHGTIDMGGMMTLVKVRDGITSYADPGWFENPPGTQARAATADELSRDGIELP